MFRNSHGHCLWNLLYIVTRVGTVKVTGQDFGAGYAEKFNRFNQLQTVKMFVHYPPYIDLQKDVDGALFKDLFKKEVVN